MSGFWLFVADIAPSKRTKRWAMHRWADTLPEHLRLLGHMKAEFGA